MQKFRPDMSHTRHGAVLQIAFFETVPLAEVLRMRPEDKVFFSRSDQNLATLPAAFPD